MTNKIDREGKKMIYIRWTDATSKPLSWLNLDECLKWGRTENWEVESLGFLIEETKEYILMALSRGLGNEEEPCYGELFKIPKTWIRIRKTINL